MACRNVKTKKLAENRLAISRRASHFDQRLMLRMRSLSAASCVLGYNAAWQRDSPALVRLSRVSARRTT
jgi:hypothetical protein